MKNIFKINTLTYLFFLLSILSGYYKNILCIYLILIIHELGHYIIMKIYKIKVSSITLYPYGGMIKSNMLINTNSKKVLLISLGGIILQLIFILIIIIIYNLNLIDISIYKLFIENNLYIIIFNLVPIYPLDGFKILNSTLELIFNYKKSNYISFIINIIFLIVFFLYLYIFKISNYLIIIFLIINLINYIKEFKYTINKFYIERYLYDIEYNGLISVKNINKMYKNKLNYINGKIEKEYLTMKFAKRDKI